MRILIAARSVIFAVAFAALMTIQAGSISSAWANAAGTEIADRLVDLLTSYGAKDARYDDADYDSGSDIATIYGFSLSNPRARTSITVQNIQMAGVKLHAGGALSSDELFASKISLVNPDEGSSMSIRQITIVDPLFPEKAAVDGNNNAFFYRLASEFLIEDLVIRDENLTVPIATIYANRGPLDGDIPETMDFVLENMIIQTEEVEDLDARENLEKFGYEEIDFSFSSVWSWDSSTEESVIGPVNFTVVDMGAVTIELTLGGVSREMLLALDDENRMMEMAQLLSFISLDYQAEDDSIIDRMVSSGAADANLSPSTMIGIWVDQLRQQMTDQDMPANFVKMFVTASEYFMNNPGTFTLLAEPKTPVLLSQLMGSVMFGPAAIIPLLNITVVAE